MKRMLLNVSAIAVSANMLSPSVVFAGKGGQPAAQAIANGQGVNHAHQNGKARDPQPDHGNDSLSGDGMEEGEFDQGTDYQDATTEEEGEEDEEGAEQY